MRKVFRSCFKISLDFHAISCEKNLLFFFEIIRIDRIDDKIFFYVTYYIAYSCALIFNNYVYACDIYKRLYTTYKFS